MPTIEADVLIVTVTDVEKDAVLNAFYKATNTLPQAVNIGDRTYQNLGIINGSTVYMASSKMGAIGLGAAQQTVEKGIKALNPHAVIMVGIAFGVDDEKQAIGDILVSRQLMLYDPQRVGKGEIVPRGDKVSCTPRLDSYLDSAKLHWKLKGNSTEIRFGLVLTGEKLIDKLSYRKSLKKLEPEFIGGEMEGAGLYVSSQDAKVDWILVKAICDWADGNKEQDRDQRQQLAANNAASFVLFALQHEQLLRLTATLETVPSSKKKLKPKLT